MWKNNNIHAIQKGQTSIEYLTYFAFFLMIAASFSSFIYLNSSNEFSERSQQRFKSVLIYVADNVRDANILSQHVDRMEINVTLPVVVKGAGITIQGDENKGIVQGNTTVNGNNVFYYMKIGSYKDIIIEQGIYGDDNVITIRKR